MIKRLLILVIALTLITPVATSATQSPSPTPKATASNKATPIKKPVVKKIAVIKKNVVTKKGKKRISPSPSPKWPPVGFKSSGEVFAKIPSAKELIGTASNDKKLAKALAQKVDGVPICEKFSCGAIQVASLNGCTWWEVNAKLAGEVSTEDATRIVFGTIRALVRATAPKEIVTVLLVSQEPLELHHRISGISANCHHDAASEKIPSSTYTASNN
ncbi:MAG: hypothetical protein Q7R42_01900 [Candidatus Planktophila sp.]|nr:hypothetical protein [Candidatus Planktophila sp.]